MTATRPYHDGAPIYQAAGWTGILPLPPGRKKSPPTSYTGWHGKDPSAKMIETWRTETVGEYQGASNIALRVPHNEIGVDVDHYDEKTGGDTLAKLEKDLGPLPATYTSTSRDEGVSRIRWFRVDTDVPLKWPTGPGKDIEFIHFGHRYAVVWPSVHPDTGQVYKWYDHDGTLSGYVPEHDELAELPWEWVARFTGGETYDGSDPVDPATSEQVSQCLTGGEVCQAAANGVRKYLDESTVSKSHHDAMRDSILYLVRLGEQGHRGVAKAIGVVRALFEQYAQGRDKYEVDRAIDGGVALVLAKPTAEKDKRCCGSTANNDAVRALTTNLPEEFWSSRSVLGRIRQAAHSRGRSADVVLYATLARISAMVSPLFRFENCLGEGSLNLFVAPVGKSGRGKSAGNNIAKTLIHTPASLSGSERFRDSIGIGSGEGLAELYMGSVYEEDRDRPPMKDGTYHKKKVKKKLRDNAFVYVDEGQTLNQQGRRQGNIVLPTIRSAWNGETLGQSNASEETTRHVPAGSYSLGMVIGYQKDTAQEMLGDVAPGTPQRFIMCSATDPAVPLQSPMHPGHLDVDLDLVGVGKITFHQEINAELWQQNHAKVTGAEEDDDELDSHEPLMLSKLSALLCLLEGRKAVTLDDWALAKIMYATSRAVMDDLVEYGKEIQQNKADAYADAHATREARAHLAKKNADSNVARIARLAYGHVHDAGGVMTVGAAKQKHNSRDRGYFHDALDYAVGLKWLTTDGKKVAIGLDVPPS